MPVRSGLAPILWIYLLVTVLQGACLLDDEGERFGTMVSKAATEMIASHEQERTVLYHPRRGASRRYSVEMASITLVPVYLVTRRSESIRAGSWW